MRKVLVVGIIVLFLGISVLPIVSSKSVSSPFEMLLEHGSESEVNDKTLDDYKEVISTVEGYGRGIGWNYHGLLVWTDLYLVDGRYNIKSFTINPLKFLYQAKAKSMHMKLFIGWIIVNEGRHHSLWGLVIGDITWEPYE